MLYLLALVALGAAVTAAIVAWAVSTFRRLRGLRQATNEAWVSLRAQLAARHELVAGVVESLEGQVAQQVRVAQSEAAAAQGVASCAKAEQRLSSVLGGLPEHSPELQAANREINTARQRYNEAVMSYNTVIQSGLEKIAALAFSFETATFFEQQDHSSREIKPASGS